MTRPLILSGAIGSPYTRKMRSLMLYRHIPYQFVGRTYAPFMLANLEALEAGKEETHCEIDGQHYWQRAFGYQRKCLGWLRDEYAKLSARDRSFVDGVLAGTGCEPLVG